MDCKDRLRTLLLGLHAEGGQTLAEYGIIITVVAIIVVVAALLLGSHISSLFSSSSGHL